MPACAHRKRHRSGVRGQVRRRRCLRCPRDRPCVRDAGAGSSIELLTRCWRPRCENRGHRRRQRRCDHRIRVVSSHAMPLRADDRRLDRSGRHRRVGPHCRRSGLESNSVRESPLSELAGREAHATTAKVPPHASSTAPSTARLGGGDWTRTYSPLPLEETPRQVHVTPGGSQLQVASPYSEEPSAKGHEVQPMSPRSSIRYPPQPAQHRAHSTKHAVIATILPRPMPPT